MAAGSNNLPNSAKLGFLVFVIFCGLPAAAMNGFFGGWDIPFTAALVSATLGGIVGGVLICPKPWSAGFVGGLLAGPVGLLAVYYYTKLRAEVFDIELVLVQMVASIPGVAVGFWIKRFLEQSTSEPDPAAFGNTQ
ncbi:MAG TPA: hypothetical protein VGJ15_08745 [Pirellulales bacterium]|jgi:hypothetical protein